ncbi:hypothetical protein ACSBR1_020129 [Camellia fascicularis]
MDRYQRVEKLRREMPINENEICITTQGRIPLCFRKTNTYIEITKDLTMSNCSSKRRRVLGFSAVLPALGRRFLTSSASTKTCSKGRSLWSIMLMLAGRVSRVDLIEQITKRCIRIVKNPEDAERLMFFSLLYVEVISLENLDMVHTQMKSVHVVDLGEQNIDIIITQSVVIHMLEECVDLGERNIDIIIWLCFIKNEFLCLQTDQKSAIKHYMAALDLQKMHAEPNLSLLMSSLSYNDCLFVRVCVEPKEKQLRAKPLERSQQMAIMITRSLSLLASSPLISLLFVLVLAIDGQEFTIKEATIDGIQRAFTENRLTSRQLVDFYLNQIETLNPVLRGVMEVNPDAVDQAEKADRERKRNQGRQFLGDLHGVPVLLKDSIGTKDNLNATVGSYALLGSVVARDATVVERLRKAGAVIMGKASVNEWYGFRSWSILEGWCARSGQGLNPYVLSGNTCGSSSGSAISVAANMVFVSLGTETDGSIICPADHNSVVGIKPTVGLTTRAGVVTISPRQDTIGPICRTVSDAVCVLDAIVGFDPRDFEATKEAAKFIPAGGYKQFLNKDGLKGKRLGVVRKPFLALVNRSKAVATFEHHLYTLRKRGAIVVDNLHIANIDEILDPHRSGELMVMASDFKISINAYLKELITSPVRSLTDIITFNQNNPELEKLAEYGQQTFIEAEESTGIGEKEIQVLENLEKLSKEGFEKLMKENDLDALVTPGSRASPILAIGGYPAITVPAGYDSDGMPFGICFGGLRGTEPKLVEIAYGFEQATKVRRPPCFSTSELSEKHASKF